MTGTISEVILNEDTVRPICIQFQNGKLQEGEEKHLKTAVLKGHKKLIAAVATKEILYTGNINRDDELYNNFLLVRNRKTGKIRLVAVDNAILSPKLDYEKSENYNSQVSNNVDSAASELNKQFGSKKIKRMTEQKERLTMDIDNVKEQLEQTVAAVDITDSEIFTSKPEENNSVYRPPINRNASSLEQVYALTELVPDHILESLDEEANYTLEADLSTLSLSPFISQKLKELIESPLKRKVEKCRLLLLVNYLIKFVTTPAKNITKRFSICNSSKEVNDYVLNSFSVVSNTGRTRPLSMRDKTICYILVFLANALDYQVDVELLSKDLKIGVKKLQELARVLAFSSHSKDKNIMILRLPLPPAVSIMGKKRRR